MIRHTAVKYVHFILATAILDFWRMSTSRDTGSGTIKKFDPENMGTGVGILLLCALELEIYLGVKYPPAAGKRRQKLLPGQGLSTYNKLGGITLCITEMAMH